MQKFTISMQEFIISYGEIIINCIPKFCPLKVKYIYALGTAFLNRYLSIRDVRCNKHKVSIIDIADSTDITDGMSYFIRYDRLYTISLLSDRNTKYNPYNKLSRFK